MNPKDPLQTAHHRIPPGTRLNGIYEIDHLIGVGGMGEIYKSHEIQTGTAVAIKMLLPDMAANESALALFRREASALHYLMHDAIVRYFVFTVEPVLQRPYLAMEFVDGRSLADMLTEGPLTFEALLRLMRRVASGLNAAHERGITHRDVSPDNIIVPKSDVARAKIIDFGIARSTQLNDATIIGNGFAGKHNFVSPEQVGLFGGDVTAKSDVYSFGLVLFYALTGTKLDMGGTQFQLVEKRRRSPDLGAVDARIRPLLEMMLQPDPANRLTMAEIENWKVGLAKNASGNSSERRDASIVEVASSSGRMRPWIRYGALTVLSLSALIASGVAYYKYVWLVPTEVTSVPAPQLTQEPSDKKIPVPTATQAETRKEPPAMPTKLPNEIPVRTDVVRRFVQQYEGGECFFVTPVAVSASAAVLEGFGASTTPFDSLDKAFRASQGFEPSIGVRLVTPAQCPAVSFLNRLREGTRPPRISLNSVKLKPGEALAGNIENFANRVVELLLITDDGQVQNVSYLLKPGTDALSFSSNIDAPRMNAPQLLMAVTTPRVLDSLRQPRPTSADQFFFQALSEAQRSNITMNASARYFTIQK
ncbi:serine/threonine-protein kinase [Bradyrhizobium sp. JYMT SZCCT0428]|uniref:serine/threonine-protein kinase n=1 Tax=Bradyrhizobium sp. JYMT SZCCT0428 TaxID=2807673 RepID=UPI001BA8BAC4|nr:serine/threonine-protein kinase [Bradyrhizobium sp. JYMT SZCCT0428]MBR1155203.1 protein kinase [Bradyrhizobium sp. JYMT SZCCT0428]